MKGHIGRLMAVFLIGLPSASGYTARAAKRGGGAAAVPHHSIEGFWQGTLNTGAIPLRLVFKIHKKPDGTLTGTLDSIDQGAKDIPTTRVNWTNPELQLEWQGLGATYNARLEGGTLRGIWQQGTASSQLDFVRTNSNSR